MSHPTQDRDPRDGFTLIELLIVMTIIGILAAIAVPKLNVTREKAYRTTMQSDLKTLANAQEIYFNIHFTYSSDLAVLEAAESQGVAISVNEATSSGWSATASHAGMTSDHCGVYYGDATATGGDPASAAGVIACTF